MDRFVACVYIFASMLRIASANSHSHSHSLRSTFYDESCPALRSVVKGVLHPAIRRDKRLPASLLHLHFHDCFPNGCDGSILLDDTPTFTGEQKAPANNNSIRGMDVVDDVKSVVEAVCPGVVSCADILTIATAISIAYVNGPSWKVLMGRRDGTTAATYDEIRNALPTRNSSLDIMKRKFSRVGLNTKDFVVLSGAHTIGRARCITFLDRLYAFSGTGSSDPILDSSYKSKLQGICPQGGDTKTLADLDQDTRDTFDNKYFSNLVAQRGLLQSDQALYSTFGAETMSYVHTYSNDQHAFFKAFGKSMIKMGNINILTGSQGEIRATCGQVNNHN